MEKIHSAVSTLTAAPAESDDAAAAAEVTPAVSVRRSLASKEHIISMIDGKPYKTLKRHLSRHGLTPEQYRERFGLRSDYPMVSETYAETRRNLAKQIGLGRKPGAKAADAAAGDAETAAKPKAPRKAKARASDANGAAGESPAQS